MQQTLDEILRGGGQALVLLFVAGIRRISLVSSAFSRRSRFRPFIFIIAISSRPVCFSTYTRPTLPSKESCSTFLTFFPPLGLAYACFFTSEGASWCLPRVKSKLGPISCSSTLGMRVPLFLYLMAH